MAHYKILVIDYEPRGVAQLRDPLHAAGYLVSVAHDGIAGMKQFDEIKPDLTLVEAMLPKKHGFEVCRDLKQTQHGSRSPVVIVTSVYRGRKYRTQAFHNYNCDEFLEKPISSATLLSTVERLLEGRDAMPVEASPASPPEPAPKPAPEQQAKSKPESKPGPARTAPAVEEEAELEITEALDDLFGDGKDSGPQASGATVPDGENILSFDPSRGRESGAGADAPGGGAGRSAGTDSRGGAQAARSLQPEHAHRPLVTPKAWPEIREHRSRSESGGRRRSSRGRLLLLLTILVVAGVSSAVFLLLNWPF